MEKDMNAESKYENPNNPPTSPPFKREAPSNVSSFYSKLKGLVSQSSLPLKDSAITSSSDDVESETESDPIFDFDEDREKVKPKEDKSMTEEEKTRSKEDDERSKLKSSGIKSFIPFASPPSTSTVFGSPPGGALNVTNATVVTSPPKEISVTKKEEKLGSIHIEFTTIFDEQFSAIVTSSANETGLLENIQLTLASARNLQLPDEEQQNKATQLRSSSDKVIPSPQRPGPKYSTPMIKELSVVAVAPFDFILNKFPMEVCAFLTLKNLHIEKNFMKEIPASIGQLISLQYLNISHNQIKTIPTEFRSLTSLITLNLSFNQLGSIPNIGTLVKLEYLKIRTSLNVVIYLYLNNNELYALPDMVELTSLKELYFNNNKVAAIPSGKKLPDLTTFNSKAKRAVDLWSNLTNLTSLNLQSNKINMLSTSLQALISLTEVDLSYNLLGVVPSGVGNLTNLTRADLSHNALTALPNELETLEKLKSFHFSFNKLSTLVPLHMLSSLENLDMSHNSLTSLVPLPSSLKQLSVQYNDMITLPSHLASLPRLTSLDVSHNKISILPGDLFTTEPGMTSLQYFNLSNNKLQLLLPELCQLANLKELDVSENTLISMPTELEKLTSLESLRLHSTKVMVLPKSLPLSLNELTLANISINRRKEEVFVLYQDTNLKNQLSVLIQSVRSVPHPLTVFALGHYFTKTEENREALLQQGALEDFFSFITSSDRAIRIEATRALANVFEYSSEGIQEYFEDKYLDILMDLIHKYDIETKVQAIRCLGNASFNASVRSTLLRNYPLDQFVAMHKNATEEFTKVGLNKLLNILGAHDYLHFTPQRTRGIRILAMDGGGTRALVTLEVLKKIEELTKQRIPDLFDLILGTSTGGILASLVGIRQNTLDQCETLYKDFSARVFLIGSNPNSEATAWSKLFNYTNMLKSGAFYKAETLMDVLSKKCGSERMIDTTMNDSIRSIKVAFVSAMISKSPPEPYLFRNYNYPEGRESRYTGDCRTAIFRALRASTAAPSYFDPYIRSDKEVFFDGALIANNPSAIAIHEAKCLWPDRSIECVLSLGTGSPASKYVKTKGFLQGLMRTLIRAATSPKTISDVLTDVLNDTQYFRFSPVGDAFEIGLDETNEEVLKRVQAATRKYLEEPEVQERMRQLCNILQYQKMS